MAKMQPKDVYYATEREDRGIGYLMNKFEFSTEKELFEEIRRIMPAKSKGLIKNLGRMKKQQEKHSRKCNGDQKMEGTSACGGHEKTTIPNNAVIPEKTPKKTPEKIPEEIPQESCMSSNTSMDLPQLQQLEEEIKAKISALDEAHGILARVKTEMGAKFVNAQKALDELMRLLDVQENNVKTLYATYQESVSNMKNVEQQKSDLLNKLGVVSAQIADLKRITILVYKNATIDVENADIPSIRDDQVESEFKKLISMPEAEELTIKEIKFIAKLRLMVKAFEADDCTVDIVFESESVQRFWETVTE